MTERVEISIIVPMYNEDEVLGLFFEHIVPILASITSAYEIVYVNDGSADRTLKILLEVRRDNPKIKVIDLSRNFGKEAALTAGIDHASGQAVILMDADLQHPPELIIDMVAKWREGHDLVMVVRSNRDSEGLLKRSVANTFYRMMSRLSEVPIQPNSSDFCLMDRQVVSAFKQLPERSRFMKGIFAWLGFRQAIINHIPPPRAAGTTKWRYWKLWNFALDGITSFTSLPLRIWTYFGVLTAITALIYAFYIVARTLIYGVDIPGYASIIVILLFFSGLNMLSTGILGEYLARVFTEVKRRPLYLIKDCHGIGETVGQKREEN